MKHVTLLCVADTSDRALELLRSLGCVQVEMEHSVDGAAKAEGEFSRAVEAVRRVEKARKDAPVVGTERRSVEDVLKLSSELDADSAAASALSRKIEKFAPWGDFDPVLARELLDRGIELEKVAELPPELPDERLSAMRERFAALEASCAEKLSAIAATDLSWIVSRFPALRDAVDFAAAKGAMGNAEGLSWFTGWIPVPSVPALRAKAVTNSWGIALRDPEPGEDVPVFVRPPKLFRPVAALFKGLGIAPGYLEGDVSVPFLCYFSLFFAMLVGDGAYGAIFLAATLWAWHKTKPAEGEGHRPRVVRSWLALMTVFSSATVIWGILSNTWFGASIPWFADWPTVKWLADPSYKHMMLLCFTIGVSHLMLARIWNGVCRINDSTALAEFGWAGVLYSMYVVTNCIVGVFPSFPSHVYWVGGISVALVFLFTVKPSELRTRGAELGMLPLNIMGALGDIISYVRLFAVGLASVKVAENFNMMATGLVDASNAWWLNAIMAVLMVAILVVGHALNLAMAGLSILVHAVRLNTLEFSNHKGVSWSGRIFDPFKKNS